MTAGSRSTDVAALVRAVPAGSRLGQRRRGPSPLPFIAPFFVVFAVFTIVPLGYAAYLSLFSEQSSGLGFGGAQTVFVGLGNFAAVLSDTDFLGSFGIIGVYCVFYIPLMIGAAIVITLLLDSGLAIGGRFLQLVYYLPNVVPGLIAAIIWLYLYTPGISPLVDVVEGLSSAEWSISSLPASIVAVANVTIWLHVGYNVVIFFAALQAIPRETLEAARVDGAGQLRVALSVKVPMIRGAISIAVLMTIVGAMQLFAEPMLLSSRAPGIDSTWTPNMYIYQKAFTDHNFGVAAAAALVFAVLIGAASWVATRVRRR
ncbi:binding-protein-dependent transport systems inner membrane component [Beutenbergia cavernae DSM 12333]|uniref:Binding-protein-dependent transport systems inner membrane component n=1 Tax=Beutenbergia cavernae (strain ATCC BAA-8 / DSM 12333 / CCUG 43141 / JCM 11478 / NBRC 16432 / NCIMB 13614 / HKI 0122) TaxID=471853 RepID=C5C5U1_BEUC1|nr:sugar ABC transporter permease [Beutenbergia cavernae]ACQ82299.1 binding-protein-dependent transport systems inner membrane component [Beutenbergia cavernae DSM 12333]